MVVLSFWLIYEMQSSASFIDFSKESKTIQVTLLVFCIGYSIQVSKNAAAFYYDKNDKFKPERCVMINLVQLSTYILQDVMPVVAILCIHRRNFSEDKKTLPIQS